MKSKGARRLVVYLLAAAALLQVAEGFGSPLFPARKRPVLFAPRGASAHSSASMGDCEGGVCKRPGTEEAAASALRLQGGGGGHVIFDVYSDPE